MSTTLHDPEDKKTYHKGANSDLEKEFVGRGEPGKYINAQNMRPEPIDGEQGALSKIKGEILLFPGNEPGAATYICLLACEVGGHNVQYWANTDTQYPPLVMIDGLVMVKSALLPWLWDKPFQWARAEDCDEGLLLAVDDNSIPMLFSISDIIEKFNAGSLLYFDDFDPAVYYINPTAPVERPKFLGLVDVGAGGGLKPGQYAYALRFVDADGNRTNIAPYTPLVSIPVNLTSTSQYNIEPGMIGGGLQGGALGDVGQQTRYGAQLRFRINNTGNYARIELIRLQINVGQGTSTNPTVVVAHIIDIAFGINPWVDFVDIGTVLETIADAEANTQALYILKAKGVRYIDNRYVLANIEVAPKDVELTFREVNGKKIFAITSSIGKAGHHDPVNNCYKKSYIRGERYKFAIQLFDGLGGKPFVVPLPDEFFFPNRRDEKADDSLAASDSPCYAPNVDHVVTPTFEAFDMEDAVSKGISSDVYNVMIHNNDAQYFAPVTPTQPNSANKRGFNYNVNTVVRHTPDLNASELQYNPQVFEPNFHAMGAVLNGVLNLPEWVAGFSIVRSEPAGRVICQGLASYRITSGTETTDPVRRRNRVVVTFPDINSGIVQENDVNDFDANPGNFSLQFVSPVGFASEVWGGVSFDRRPLVRIHPPIAGILTNMVIDEVTTDTDRSEGVSVITDQISYARILWDEGQINPGYALAGIQPTLPGTPHSNWVGYKAWRNRVPVSSGPFHGGGNNGNSLVSIASVQELDLNGHLAYEVALTQDLYDGHASDVSDFMSNDTAAFHEPVYVVNLVQDGAHVQEELIPGWIPTGHYQRTRSIIGESNGAGGQQFTLIDERVEDVLTPVGSPLEERYVWVNNNAWICITNTGINAAQLINDVNQNGFWLSPLGVQIYGFYQVLPGNNDIEIGFFGVNPPAGAKIEIRYNPLAGIKFFGGDSTISPNLAMAVNAASYMQRGYVFGDNDYQPVLAGPPMVFIGNLGDNIIFNTQYSPSPEFLVSNAADTLQLSKSVTELVPTGFFGITVSKKQIIPPTMALPFSAYKYNANYYEPYGIIDTNGSLYNFMDDNIQFNGITSRDRFIASTRSAINKKKDAFPGNIRQWGLLFDCECRTPNHFAAFIHDNPNQGYPSINYIMHPFSIDSSAGLGGNGVFDDYGDAVAYGPGEINRWTYGGFRWLRPANYDYAAQMKESSFSKPAFGYEEKTDLCNVVVWTPRVTSQVQNSPGYRTYPATNIRWLQSDTGGINKLYSAVSSNGFNLYALTETGVCELLIGKNILTSADGNALATTRQDEFIGAEVWRSKMIGIPDMCWQLCGEGYWGNPKADALYFADRMSAYVLVGSQIVDIGKGQYRTQIQPLVQAAASSNIAMMNGWFDASRDEWGFSARSNVRVGTDFELVTDPSKTLVYSASPLIQGWVGEFTYLFDKVFHLRGNVYGMRDQQTWLLDQGYVLNGQPIEAWAHQVSAPLAEERMEWLWIKVGSILKPTYVKFYDEDDNHVCTLDAAAAVSFGYAPDTYLKRTAGWERQIPRRTANRQRLQGQRMGFRVGHIGEDPFRLPGASVQWKKIK